MGKRCNCERCEWTDFEVTSKACQCGTVFQQKGRESKCPHCEADKARRAHFAKR